MTVFLGDTLIAGRESTGSAPLNFVTAIASATGSVYTDPDLGVWLKTGFYEDDLTLYPDAMSGIAPVLGDSLNLTTTGRFQSSLMLTPDGTKLFVTNRGQGTQPTMEEYSLSTPFDLTTSSLTTTFTIAIGTNEQTRGKIISNLDGTLFSIALSVSRVRNIVMTTGFDLSTASLGTLIELDDYNSLISASFDLSWNSDGTSLSVFDLSDDLVYLIPVPTAYDILSIPATGNVTVAANPSVDGDDPDINAIYFTYSDDFTKIFFIDQNNNRIYEYDIDASLNITDGPVDIIYPEDLGGGSFPSITHINGSLLLLNSTNNTVVDVNFVEAVGSRRISDNVLDAKYIKVK